MHHCFPCTNWPLKMIMKMFVIPFEIFKTFYSHSCSSHTSSLVNNHKLQMNLAWAPNFNHASTEFLWNCFCVLFYVLCCAVGSHEARGRSVVRCTAWKTETCGARPAAGRKPARDLLTETADGWDTKTGWASFCMHSIMKNVPSLCYWPQTHPASPYKPMWTSGVKPLCISSKNNGRTLSLWRFTTLPSRRVALYSVCVRQTPEKHSCPFLKDQWRQDQPLSKLFLKEKKALFQTVWECYKTEPEKVFLFPRALFSHFSCLFY